MGETFNDNKEGQTGQSAIRCKKKDSDRKSLFVTDVALPKLISILNT